MLTLLISALSGAARAAESPQKKHIKLPKPASKGKLSVEQALWSRRTCRGYTPKPLTLGQLSQLLWAAYGVTADKYGIGLKTAPSAGALYPLDVYAVVGKDRQEGLEAGVYAYNPSRHALSLSKSGDLRKGLARAALGQMWMAQAPVIMLISGEYARSTAKYGQRGVMYTHMESGFVGQNLFLQAGALGLRAGVVGAFDNRAVASTLGLPSRHDPLLAMPVGYGA